MRTIHQEKIWDSLYEKDENKWKLESKLPKVLNGKKVLEIGAGNGKTLRSILSQRPSEVYAIDISSKATEILSRKFQKSYVLKANILNLPFQKESFDVVVCFFTLNNLLKSERKKAISEIHRVLKCKGMLIFSDFAIGDYRAVGKKIEVNTIILPNKLILHSFSIIEMKSIFKSFKVEKLKMISSNPIRSQPKLKRKRIFMLAHR